MTIPFDLDKHQGERLPFTAEIDSFPLTSGSKKPRGHASLARVCLLDGTPVLENYWCHPTAEMLTLNLKRGDKIGFEARITLHRDAERRYPNPSHFMQRRTVTLDRMTRLEKLA
jgi:hypothetical protein